MFPRQLLGLTVVTLVGLVSPAWAQRDGGVPDSGGGGGGTASYITFEDDASYQERVGGTALNFGTPFPGQVNVNLPFPFRFYENDYTSMLVGSAGLVGFNANSWVGSGGNHGFPDPFSSGITNMIAAFWDDFFQPVVSTHEEGSAPDRVFIIQWKSSQLCCGGVPGEANVQLHLHEGAAGRFEIHVGPHTFPVGSRVSGSIGFQDQGATRGTNLAFCTPNCAMRDLDDYRDRMIVATQDAGLDVFARRVEVNVGGIGRVYQGVPFPAEVTLASYHGNPIGPFRYQLHLVLPTESVPNNPIYTSPLITLSPFQTLVEPLDVTVPLGQAAGRYRLLLVVDSDGVLPEANELNNQAFGTQDLLISDPKPDFTAVALDTPSGDRRPGGTITVPLTIGNIGNLTGDVAWLVVLSSNNAPSATDLHLASGTLNLELLTEAELEATGTLPSNLPPGTYTLGLIVDPAQAVAELSEVNNTLAGATLEVDGGPLGLLSTSLPAGYVGLEYSGRLNARGGNGSYLYTLASGSVPDGLTLIENGQLLGRPTAPGESTFSVTVESGRSQETFGPITLNVSQLDGPLAIITRALVPGIAGQPYPPAPAGEGPELQQRIVAVGGNGAVTFSLISGGPPGLTLDADGYLHGVANTAGRYELVIGATDGAESTQRRLGLWIVESGRLTLVPTELAEAVVGQSYQANLVVLGQTVGATLSFSVNDGALPSGLALTRTGVLSGIPGQVGTFSFRAEVTEGAGDDARRDSAELVLVVASTADFAISPSSVPTAILGRAYEVTFEARRGTPPFTWRADNNALPRGLSGEVVVGEESRYRISGTPEVIPDGMGISTGGVVTVPLSVVDALGRQASLAVALRIVEAPPEAPAPDDGGCGCTTHPSSATGSWAFALLALGLCFRRR